MTTIIISFVFVAVSVSFIFAAVLLAAFIFGKKSEKAAKKASEKEAELATKAAEGFFDLQRFSGDFEMDLCYDQIFLFKGADITNVMEHGLGFTVKFAVEEKETVDGILKGMHRYIIGGNNVRIALEEAMEKKITHWPENSLSQMVFESEEECDMAEKILRSLGLEYQRF